MGLAGLRQGAAYLKPSAGRRKWTPFIGWRNGDAKTVLFLTPIDQVAKVKIHDFVKVPDDSEKGWHFDTFMCRKDPAWMSESNGECYCCDVLGHKTKDRHVAVGVELDVGPNSELTVKTRSYNRDDGTVTEYPQWGVIQQGFRNFYNYFTAFGQKQGGINHVAFDVSRVGGDQDTSYVIMPLVGSTIPDVSPYMDQIPSVVEILEEMGSAEKYSTELSGADKLDQTPEFGDTFAPEDQNGKVVQTKFEQLKAELQAKKPEELQLEAVESFSG